jgi:hypothetical protein
MGFGEFFAVVISLTLVVFFIVAPIFKAGWTTDMSDPKKKKIKCNVSGSGKKIYHMPGDKLYEITKVDPNKGEMFVDTEHDAIKMGFKRSQFK